MAKQIEGAAERIIAAADAGTNSIYVRFGDGEGLFSTIVKPVSLHRVL